MARVSILSKHIISRAPTELSYSQKSAFNKDVIAEKNWSFELAVKSEFFLPTFVIVGFQEKNRSANQYANDNVFCRASVLGALGYI